MPMPYPILIAIQKQTIVNKFYENHNITDRIQTKHLTFNWIPGKSGTAVGMKVLEWWKVYAQLNSLCITCEKRCFWIHSICCSKWSKGILRCCRLAKWQHWFAKVNDKIYNLEAWKVPSPKPGHSLVEHCNRFSVVYTGSFLETENPQHISIIIICVGKALVELLLLSFDDTLTAPQGPPAFHSPYSITAF